MVQRMVERVHEIQDAEEAEQEECGAVEALLLILSL
jgi:hypothetical protein